MVSSGNYSICQVVVFKNLQMILPNICSSLLSMKKITGNISGEDSGDRSIWKCHFVQSLRGSI